MTSLNDYLQQLQRYMRDQRQELLNPSDLISYVNAGRREVAMRSSCVRFITPISGSVSGISITAVGSGYTGGATVSIAAPDFPSGAGSNPTGLQATATVNVTGGTLTSGSILVSGAGYYQPTVSIVGAGTGASVTLTVGGVNKLIAGAEVYPFSSISLAAFSGVDSVYMIKSISIIYSNFRYSLPCYSFSEYQAKIRNYPFQYQWVPAFCSQFGQGTSGSFYVYPVPSTAYQYECDCFCLPSDLTSNTSTEVLPAPWTEAVPLYAAHRAYLELQNFNVSSYYLKLFDEFVNRYGTYARPGRAVNPYGRYLIPLAFGSLELLHQIGGVLT